MPASRRHVLIGLLALLLAVAGAVLFEVAGTVFFALTVAYVLTPLYHRVEARGLSPWWASAVTSVLATLVAALLTTAIVSLLYLRSDVLIDLVREVPASVVVDVLGFRYAVDLSVVAGFARGYLADLVFVAVQALPVLAVKVTLFGLLVFALLMRHREAQAALLGPIPPRFHDVVRALERRAGATLYGIYVIQVATGVGTFLLAAPTFFALGYEYPVTLAVVAGTLQFLPIVGPSLLVGLLALYQTSLGNVDAAILVLVVAGFVVAWLPDVLIRPRLSRERARLPGSLYFIGFTGGLLTVGTVGIIAGPLVVALVVEATQLLADEEGSTRQTQLVE
ncbi:AI-2E family transporter [Halospeciosus flavus]|uniref:AI-2E family transporter n=1 Tax=Halospeciosus flavus TaxID=3032283 RepID=A0ABD5Z727_9EURY|nr:AI-2E family transporter [Halospeciosus flavus]